MLAGRPALQGCYPGLRRGGMDASLCVHIQEEFGCPPSDYSSTEGTLQYSHPWHRRIVCLRCRGASEQIKVAMIEGEHPMTLVLTRTVTPLPDLYSCCFKAEEFLDLG